MPSLSASLSKSPRIRTLWALLVAATITPLALFVAAEPASAVSLETWERVAACESGSNWSINTGNGFYGGLQFTAATWAEFGGIQYASSAHLATKEQQIAVAERVLQSQGPGAWPVCSLEAELTRDASTPQIDTSIQAPLTAAKGALTAHKQAAKAPAPGSAQGSAPVDGGTVTTRYRQPGPWAAGYHTGIDFAVPTGTPVHAVRPGIVVAAGWEGAYGNCVTIQHDDGLYTLSAHLSTTTVTPGQLVSAGEQIGLSGSTGNSTGPHLHFEVRTSNTYRADIDPAIYLQGQTT
ncbi:transglycosylase family protein [Streptomyces sp. NPDC002659]|uniref:transglycosylase family protein n=1 Tax=Streptomyces sp. NPDC002659 TaxID=3364656 RepID=UPI0036A78510